MVSIFLKYYSPEDVTGEPMSNFTDEDIKDMCFRIAVYNNAAEALWAYANTPGTTWSTTLEVEEDGYDTYIMNFIDECLSHIKQNDIIWLEQNFS